MKSTQLSNVPANSALNQSASKISINNAVNLPAEELLNESFIRHSRGLLNKKRLASEAVAVDSESVVMSDVTGLVVAQAEAAAVTSLGGTAGAVTGAAAVTESAAVVSGAASAAASAASVVTTTSLVTSTSALSAGTLASVAGGTALAAGAGGGGGADPAPAPLPPANPHPGPTNDPTTLNLSDVAVPVHQLSLAQTSLPVGVLNKSMVIDLGISYGPYQGVLYYTDKLDGVVTTHSVSYRDISNVTGTILNDQITGSTGDNLLDGGAGADIIYGAGGVDVLRGAAGEDWILFKALTRTGDAGQYNDGVVVNLGDTQLTGVTGAYRVVSWAAGAFAEASGFEHVVGSDGNDTLIGDANANILDGAGGDDVLAGGNGNDQLFGGTSTSAGVGNQMTGGVGVDTFWVGYAIDPVFRSRYIAGTEETVSPPHLFNLAVDQTGITAVQNASVIHDWTGGANGDILRISGNATAIMGGLFGVSGWTSNDIVDLRSNFYNSGLIKIAAGEGTNNLYLDNGVDVIFTGYQYLADSNGIIDGHLDPTASNTAIDIIWGWDGTSSARDRLTVASGSTAVIGFLQDATNWSGNDTVDLRTHVSNSGTIIVSAEAGSNTIYGSAGVDLIYGSSNGGTNQVWGGASADQFYVGISREAVSGNLITVETSRDLIWDWQQGVDGITVGSNGTAVIAGRMSTVDWSAADTVNLTSGVTNNGKVVIALGDANDIFVGTAGVDHIYGGKGANTITGGAGNDHFFVGYNYNPVLDTRSELGASDTAIDVIQDWQGTDNLTVGTRGQAIIGGLFATGTTWSGNDQINVSHATNNGVIRIAAGAGNNNITASTGVDAFYVGSQYSGASSLDTPSGASSLNATDVIWGWDDQTLSHDALTVASGSRAVIGALMGQTNWNSSSWVGITGWAGNDTVDLRQQVTNNGVIQIASGAGNNTIIGSSGSDHYMVGYVNNANGTTTTSAAAVDTIYGWDAQAWSDLPLTGTWSSSSSWNGQAATDSTYDRLDVALGSTVRIGSLSVDSATDAQRWDSVEIIDLRSNVINNNAVVADGGAIEIWAGSGNDYVFGSAGRDLIYGGPGLDNLWGGAGNDVFYVGYSPSWAPAGADAAEPRIWDWQNANGTSATEGTSGSPGDGLRIADGSFAIIQGLWGMDPTNTQRWDGNDTVDLRWDVINGGKIIVESSIGNDVIFGSSGVDFINPGAGYNTLDLSNGGADRVYLDNFLTRTQINGFGSDDRIYLDKRVVQSFIDQRQITTYAGYDIMASASNAATSITNGQSYDNGNFFTSEKTYDAVYNASLRAYNANPKDPDFNVYGGIGNGTLKFGWTTNGAFNNEAHEGAQLNGKIAVIAAGTISLIIGNSLAPIPFVGPLLAIPFWVNGGLMLNDGINNVRPYLNPVYNGGALDSGISTLTAANTSASTAVGTWNDLNFLSLYNPASSGGFVQSLEIGGQQPNYTAISQNTPVNSTGLTFPYTYYQAPALTGVASYLAIYNGTETFIYLVASRDSLIQNSEAILIAQVNGQVSANQLVMYNGSTDADYLRYFNNSIEAPVFPANPSINSALMTAQTSGKQLLFKANYSPVDFVTTDGSSTVTESTVATFSALAKGEKVSLGGLTFTASQDISGAQVASALSGLIDGATSGNGTAYGEYSGTLTGWRSETASGSSLTFTNSTANQNVNDLSATAGLLTKYINSATYNALAVSNSASNLSIEGVNTNDSSVSVNIGFDTALTANDTIEIYLDTQLVGTFNTSSSGYSASNNTLTAIVSYIDRNGTSTGALADGIKAISVVVKNTQGFDSKYSTSINVDTTAPDVSQITIADMGDALLVNSPEAGTAYLNVGTTTLNSVSVTDPVNAQPLQGSLTIAVQSTLSNAEVTVKDIFGHSSVAANVTLGTSGGDTFTSGARYIYGFGGNDTITATYSGSNNQGATIYGGTGDDRLIGNVKNNTFIGGLGIDRLDLNGGDTNSSAGSNAVVWNMTASGTAASDSNGHQTSSVYDNIDTVYGFNETRDSLVVVATGVAGFSAATDVTAAYNSGSAITQLGVNLDGTAGATGVGDLLVQFSGDYAGGVSADNSKFLSALRFDLTGTSANNTLVGGANADTLSGGAGSDTLTGGRGADMITGGAGSDQFIFAAGDSTPVITQVSNGGVTANSVSGYDTISDIGLVDASAGKDIINLDGAAIIAANTAGSNGSNAGAAKSHAITNGVVTFDTSDTFTASQSISLADAVAYLQLNIDGGSQNNAAVVFKASDSHTYLFQNNASAGDILIDLSVVTIAGLTTDSSVTTPNYLYIV